MSVCVCSWAFHWAASRRRCLQKMCWRHLKWRRFSMSYGITRQGSTVASGITQLLLSISLVRKMWCYFCIKQQSRIKRGSLQLRCHIFQVTDRISCYQTAANTSTWRNVFCAATWTCQFRHVIDGERWPQEAWLLPYCLTASRPTPTAECWPLWKGTNRGDYGSGGRVGSCLGLQVKFQLQHIDALLGKALAEGHRPLYVCTFVNG